MNIWEFLHQHMVFASMALVGILVTTVTVVASLVGREPKVGADDRAALNNGAALLRAFAEKATTGLGETQAARDAAAQLEEMSAR